MKRSGRFNLFSLLPISILFLAFGCQEQSEKPKTESVKAPEQIISTNQAQELFDNYSSRRAPLIQKFEDSLNKESRFDVARYGYYDYKTIKKYIAYIEQEAEKAKVEISTLRFYFGNYPNKKQFADGRKVKHPRQNSFFIVPTLKKDGKEYAPKLYDLTSIQVHCNNKYGFTADQTLKIVQKLYEMKVVSYPRVDTTYLPEDIYPKVPGIFWLTIYPCSCPMLSMNNKR